MAGWRPVKFRERRFSSGIHLQLVSPGGKVGKVCVSGVTWLRCGQTMTNPFTSLFGGQYIMLILV